MHGVLLAFPVALFPAALVSDIAYLNTAEIQWSNFSSWLIAGADVFTGLLLAWAIISLFFGRLRNRRGRGLVYTGLVAVLFVAGVLNAFQHAKDGWHSVGTLGLALSILCAVIALLIGLLGHWPAPHREHRP
ncbi:MAG: hypothetical protein JY451_11325 [Erythrobacter sp.]|nr:MAG: hypothetical protein JY451_11325 [Erythrobacter sp.]